MYRHTSAKIAHGDGVAHWHGNNTIAAPRREQTVIGRRGTARDDHATRDREKAKVQLPSYFAPTWRRAATF